MKRIALGASGLLLGIWTSSAHAEVYGGFSVGATLIALSETPGEAGFTLSGKLGGRGAHVGGYAKLRGTAFSAQEVTVGWGELVGGVDLFVSDGSAAYIQLGWSRLTGDDGTTSVVLGTGPCMGLGFDLLLVHPLSLGFFFEHGFMSPSEALGAYGVTDFAVNSGGLEAAFEW